ncbi:MAG: type II secretion system protein GspM [Solirubrobacteraceae bacterium]|nr:type II secretion system protein GspM [Solirubrobacteraceae bacterium]
MTERMKLMLGGVAILAVGALMWLMLVSPAREDATAAQDAQASAEAQAAQVDAQLVQARQAAERAPANRRTLRRLAVAVPEKVRAAQLIDQLDATAKRRGVSFDVLKVSEPAATASATVAGAGTAGGVAADGTRVDGAAGATTPGAATTTTGSAARPVSLNVQVGGDYVDVTRFVRSIQSSVRTRGGKLTARGRLLRVNAIDLGVAQSATGGRELTGTLEIVAYLLPTTTAAATSAPAGATTDTGSQP